MTKAAVADLKKDELKDSLLSSYINSENRVLDPTLLKQSALDRLPTPTGYRILVMPYRGRVKTEERPRSSCVCCLLCIKNWP